MTGLLQDLRYAARQLRKNPGFAAVAVITLALGIGMNTAVFSIVDAAALRLPFPHPKQVDVLWNSYSDNDLTPNSFPDFTDWRAPTQSFTQLVTSFRSSFNLTGVAEPQRIAAAISRKTISLSSDPSRFSDDPFCRRNIVREAPTLCLMFGVGATDAATFILSAALPGGAAALASYIPARRAAKVHPMVALRYE